MDDSVKKNTIHSIALGDGEKIRSLELVVDMASCVAQLAENCLDSGASAIEVKVDCSRLSCSVADNGRGLTLAEIGCIGNIRYSSSKDAAHGTYGFRGEALHSISLLALLELESRAAGASVTATKICSGGVTLSTTFGPPRSSNGTTVTVRDLFRDWPIRRKSLKPKLQLSRIKANLMRLSLLNYTTSWSLVDTEKGKVIWSVRGASSLLGRINEVRGPINPAFTFVSHQKAPYRVEGALALIPRSPTKPCAEPFINKRPLPSSHELISLLTATKPENSTTASAQGRESRGMCLFFSFLSCLCRSRLN
jgi:DNA mismatch repair ATPase MutL